MNDRYCFVTLATTDKYIKCACALYFSLKKVNSKYPFLLLTTNNVSDIYFKILKKNNINYKIIEQPIYFCGDSNFYKDTANKFFIYTLIQYKKICFIDADILIAENIDNIFNYPDGSFYEVYDNQESKGRLSGGIAIIKPNKNLYKSILQFYINFQTDEEIFNILYPKYYRLPKFYYKHDTDHYPDKWAFHLTIFKIKKLIEHTKNLTILLR